MAHFGGRLSSVSAPFRHTNMQNEINEPREGDYLSSKQDGEDWPIVICDEEMIQTFFTRSPRPGNARQADGTWEKDYKAGGFSISDRRFPALCLGTLKFMWAPLKELEPIDIDMGRAIRDSTANILLAKAWTEYIDQYKGDMFSEWKYLDHWKASLHAQRLDKITPGEVKKERPEGRKRKGTPTFKYPPGYRNEEFDDDESDDLFLPKESTAAPKIKRESNISISPEEMYALYGDPDPPYRTSSRSSKRSKHDLSGRFSVRPSTPLRAGTGRLETPMPSSIRQGKPFQSTNKKIDVNDPSTVVIYVGNPHKEFKVKRSGLDVSPFLSNLVTCHPENGWYIMSPVLSSLEAIDFQPIGEYIDRREYYPTILDDGTVHVRLEGDLDPEMLRYQVVRCGTIYDVAQTLEMPGLQHLVFRKLRALAPHYQAVDILIVTELLFEVGSPEVRQYLTQHVADHYWSLVRAETERMVEVMVANEDLAKGVFGILSGRDDKIKTEVVKEKGGEEVLDETKGGAKVEEIDGERKLGETKKEGKAMEPNKDANIDEADREAAIFELANNEGNVALADREAGKDQNKAGEGLSQAEDGTVTTKLRQSEEEKTKNWLLLVQRQSDHSEAVWRSDC